MNILASYTGLKTYLKTDLSPADFAREFSLRSMSVESVDEVAGRFAHMVVGIITELKAHPKADRLRIAMVDVGSGIQQIVCGGSNLLVGQRVFVALPGAKVRWHGEGELVELAQTEIRGEPSFGMICAPAEVGFEKLQGEEREIWDLSKITTAKAGTPVAEALELVDTLFDIEITTNRPDCMGMIGLAREAAAAVKADFIWSPSPLPAAAAGLPVTIEAPKLCPRYLAATVSGVKVEPSPWWLQKALLLAGHRPINNIVDITNYVLHEYGQPLHAFDAAKLEGGITVRLAKKGEVLKALDGKDYKLTSKHLVIADQVKPLAIAGVMGGLESGTSDATTTVVFEAATFEPVSIRKTARDLNLYSDSQLIFEKGLSTEALPAALAKAIQMAMQLAGGKLESVTEARVGDYKATTFPVLPKKIRARIGVEIPDDEIFAILTRLGFTLATVGARVTATVPAWREHDIESEVDLTEEVARIYSYHNLPLTLPAAPPPVLADDAALVWEAWCKNYFASLGYTEFFGYSFVDAKTLEKYGVSPQAAVRVLNPLAEDLSHLRPSLLPSLLRDIERNQANAPSAKLFELSRVHTPVSGDLSTERFALVLASYGVEDAERAYAELRGTLELFARATNLRLSIGERAADERWHPARSAAVMLESGAGNPGVVGAIGQVSDVHQAAFGITRPVFALELNFEQLLPYMRRVLSYVPVSEFPIVTRDISVVVADRTEFAALATLIKAQNILVQAVGLTDIYRGTGVEPGKKSVTLSITFGSKSRTLTSAEVEEIMLTIGHKLVGEFNATLRS